MFLSLINTSVVGLSFINTPNVFWKKSILSICLHPIPVINALSRNSPIVLFFILFYLIKLTSVRFGHYYRPYTTRYLCSFFSCWFFHFVFLALSEPRHF